MSAPADVNAEKALLGAVLNDGKAINRVRSLRPEDFHAPAHARIWRAMLDLVDAGQAVDHVSLSSMLDSRGSLKSSGGPAYLMELDQAPGAILGESVTAHAEIVRDRATRRRMLEIARQLHAKASDLGIEPGSAAQETQNELAAVGAGRHKVRTLTTYLDGVYEHLHQVQDGNRVPVIPTGFRALDNVIGGLQPTFITVGARTGVGKSAWAASLVQNVASMGRTIGVFSLEDEGEWLAWRYLSAASGVNGHVLRWRQKTDDQWRRIGEASGSFSQYSERVLVDDRPGLSSLDIAASADDMVLNHGASVILVDHMNEVDHYVHKGRETLEQKIAASCAGFRGISKRHGIPVVVLCQLVENDKTKAADPVRAGDFMHAREIVRKSRICLGLSRDFDSDEMRIDVLKQTSGKAGRHVTARFVNAAAMIRDIEGQQLDLEEDIAPEGPRATPAPRLQAVRGGGYTREPGEDD